MTQVISSAPETSVLTHAQRPPHHRLRSKRRRVERSRSIPVSSPTRKLLSGLVSAPVAGMPVSGCAVARAESAAIGPMLRTADKFYVQLIYRRSLVAGGLKLSTQRVSVPKAPRILARQVIVGQFVKRVGSGGPVPHRHDTHGTCPTGCENGGGLSGSAIPGNNRVESAAFL